MTRIMRKRPDEIVASERVAVRRTLMRNGNTLGTRWLPEGVPSFKGSVQGVRDLDRIKISDPLNTIQSELVA